MQINKNHNKNENKRTIILNKNKHSQSTERMSLYMSLQTNNTDINEYNDEWRQILIYFIYFSCFYCNTTEKYVCNKNVGVLTAHCSLLRLATIFILMNFYD